MYYLKGGTTDEVNIVDTHNDTTKLWHVRLGHAGDKSLQTLMRHRLLKGTKTCKLNFCEHYVVGKKKGSSLVQLITILMRSLNMFTVMYWDQPRLHQLVEAIILLHLLIISLNVCGCTPCEQRMRF